jgi:hypothetical protein
MYIFPPNRHDDFTIQQFTYDDFTACMVFFPPTAMVMYALNGWFDDLVKQYPLAL